MKSKDVKTCDGCDGMCCKYVAIELDAPEEIDDFDKLKWYVCHKNVNVFVNDDNEWFVEFLTDCEYLGENGWCQNYEKRSQVCRDYSQEECLFHNNDYEEKYSFKHQEDLEKYIEDVFNKGLHELPDTEDEGEEED